ncbi:MAG TPA: MFS transporter [Actinomycetes bacterium]|nr:MFS transporter [Actinomycetes bacterium]
MTSATEAPAAGSILAPTYRALTIGCLAVVSLVAFEAMAVATAMPVAVRDLGGLRLYAWSFSAFFTTSLVGMVLAGDLSDRRGPLWPFVGAVSAFGVGLVVAGTATVMPVFLLGRAMQGVGAGMVVVVLYVVVGRTYPEHMRPRVFAAISSAWVLPAVVGPLLAGLAADHLTWRLVFLAVPPLIAPAVLLMLPRLRALAGGHEDATARLRVVPAAVAAVSVATLQYAGQRLDLVSVPLLLLAVGGLAVSLPRLLPRGFARFARGLPSAVLMRGFLAGSFFGAEAFVPLMLVEERGVATAVAGATLTVAALGWTAGSWLQGRPAMTVPRERLIQRGTGLVAVGVAAVSLAVWPLLPPLVAAVGWAVGGFGMGLAMSSTSVAVLALSPTHEQGFNSAALQISDALGTTGFVGIGGAVFAALHTPGGSDAGVFVLIYLLMASVALVGVLVAPRIRDTP